MEMMKTYEESEINEIRVNSVLSQVNVVTGIAGNIVVRYTDNSSRKTKVDQQGTVLTIKDSAPIKAYGLIGLIQLRQDNTITIELPPNYQGGLQIEGKDSEVRVVGVTCEGVMRIKTGVGAITISATDAQRFDVDTKGGSVSFRGISTTNGMMIATKTGNVDIVCAEPEESYMIDCKAKPNRCFLPDNAFRGKKLMQIRTEMGTVRVNFVRE